MRAKKDFYRSQLGQDKFVVDVLNGRRGGFFLDVGASDGISVSNTYALEKVFGWKGICIEPGQKFIELKKNRNCICVQAAAGPDNGTFIDFLYYDNNPDLSGNVDTLSNELRGKKNLSAKSVKIKTLSLYYILENNHAPKYIDYLSMDTEGYEYEILKNFKFEEYKFGAITVEHNNIKDLRENLYILLNKNGYKRVSTTVLASTAAPTARP